MACHFLEHWHSLSWMEPWHASVLARLHRLWNDPSLTLSVCWPWVDHSFIDSLTRAKAIKSVTWLNRVFLCCVRARIFLYKYDMKYKKIWNKLSKKSFKKDLIHYYPQKAESFVERARGNAVAYNLEPRVQWTGFPRTVLSQLGDGSRSRERFLVILNSI
jgi:hypothetical protein